MIRIPLYGRPRTGDWQLHLVTWVQTPDFATMPDIIVWGSRFFTRTPIGDYVEAAAWFVPPTPEATSSVEGESNASAQDQHGTQDRDKVKDGDEAVDRSEEGGADARTERGIAIDGAATSPEGIELSPDDARPLSGYG